MKRPRKAADDGPGITRLPPEWGRTYQGAEILECMEVLARQQNETFSDFVRPAEERAREHAPARPGKKPARGTVAWCAAEILDKLASVRNQEGDHALKSAFEAGEWYGHLATKLAWELEALYGEGALAHNRLIAKSGGRKPKLSDEDIARLLAIPRGKRGGQIARLAGQQRVTPGAIRKRLNRALARRQK